MSYYPTHTTLAAKLEAFSQYDPQTGCQIWKGTKEKDGYGQVQHANKMYRAHRIAYQLEHPEMPEELLVLHSCGNRLCINVKHLYAGTALDNARDKTQAGTGVYHRGSSNTSTKLTEKQVREIKALLAQGVVPRKIAPLYKAGLSTVVAIKMQRTWSWLT